MLSEALLSFGASSISIEENDADESSDEICINSIFPEGPDINSCISHAADSIRLKQLPSYEVTLGEQYDWIKKTQESLNPVKVIAALWIVPEWKTAPFGAALSVGIDIDPQAIELHARIATLNSRGPEKMYLHLVPKTNRSGMKNSFGIVGTKSLNGIEVMLEAEKFDVVVANILLNPLLDLGEDIISYVKPGAVIAPSNVLSEQLPYIVERYSQFLEGISVTEMDDWACLCGAKKTNIPAAN